MRQQCKAKCVNLTRYHCGVIVHSHDFVTVLLMSAFFRTLNTVHVCRIHVLVKINNYCNVYVIEHGLITFALEMVLQKPMRLNSETQVLYCSRCITGFTTK